VGDEPPIWDAWSDYWPGAVEDAVDSIGMGYSATIANIQANSQEYWSPSLSSLPGLPGLPL
jgi:hypothetical protein